MIDWPLLALPPKSLEVKRESKPSIDEIKPHHASISGTADDKIHAPAPITVKVCTVSI